MLDGNGLNQRVVMDAINRAKRKFFLRPAYVTRHAGDLAKLALTKRSVAWQIFSRTLFGARTVDAANVQTPV
jgi:hypothetical protein